jgi:hypothetical protein
VFARIRLAIEFIVVFALFLGGSGGVWTGALGLLIGEVAWGLGLARRGRRAERAGLFSLSPLLLTPLLVLFFLSTLLDLAIVLFIFVAVAILALFA